MKHFLVDTIDKNFWNYITKKKSYKDVVNFKDIEKEIFLNSLEKNINTYHHHFLQPIYYFYPKTSGILRPIKDFSLADYCVYYYSTKEIQMSLVEEIKKVKGVFGGFKMTESLKTPNVDLHFDPEYEGFNKFGFRKEWSNYQKLAHNLHKNSYQYYIHIDIAHFYNDINLDILERNVRACVHKKAHTVDLLFHFLKNSEKKDLGYSLSNVGLPQEDVSEMSRLLANFYLTPVDQYISREIPKSFSGKFSYFDFIRFADDMWIAVDATNKEDLMLLIQKISLKLQSLKLHINESKLKILDANEFYNYWQFDSWDEIEDKKTNIPYLIQFTKELFKKQEGRWFSPFNYATRLISKKENLVHFKLKRTAQYYFSTTMFNPDLSTKITSENIAFYRGLINKFPLILADIENYLKGPRNIFPSVEHNLITLMCFDFYLNSDLLYHCLFNTEDWYTRCLILKQIAEELKTKKLKIEKSIQTKIIQLIKKIDLVNLTERRYVLYFLYYSNSPMLSDPRFSQESDQSFINYLALR